MSRRALVAGTVLAAVASVVTVGPAVADDASGDELTVTGEVVRLAIELDDHLATEVTLVVPTDGDGSGAVVVEDGALDDVPTGAIAEVTTGATSTENQSLDVPDPGAEVSDVQVLAEPTAEAGLASLAGLAAPDTDAAAADGFAAAVAAGARTVAVVAGVIAGQGGDGVTGAQVAQSIDTYVRSYWQDSTANAVSFSSSGTVSGQTYGSWGAATCTGDQVLGILNWSASVAGVYPTAGYRRHSVLYTPRLAACGFSGVAHVSDGGSAWINGVTDASSRGEVIAHELGHTLTLGHSQTRYACSGGADGVAASCRMGEYGDAYDVMGVQIGDAGPLSGAQLAVLGVTIPGSTVVASGPTTQTLQPVGGLTGTRFLRFSSAGATYVAEYRGAVGRDADLATSRQGCPTGVSTCTYQRFVPGVVVHRLDSIDRGAYTFLLDVGAGDPGHVATQPRFTLGAGQSFTTVDGAMTLTVQGADGTGMRVSLSTSQASAAYEPVVPFRLHERRSGVAPGSTTCVPVVGAVPGVGSDATAVVVNVTTVNPSGPGHVVVYPDSDGTGATAPPPTSSVSFLPGRDAAAAAFVELPASGRICYHTRGSTAGVIIDAVGSLTAEAGVRLQRPQRLEDRSGVASGAPRVLQVTGRAGVPAGATAVVLSIVGAGAGSSGNLRLWETGTPKPATSTLNYTVGGDRANSAIVALSPSGQLTYQSETLGGLPVRVVLDVVGYVLPGSAFAAVEPARLLDTRTTGLVAAGRSVSVAVGSAQGVPADATAVVLNVVGVAPTTIGNLRVYPYRAGGAVPLASTLNYVPGADVANMVVVGIGDDRKVALYTDQLSGGRTHVVADLVGYLVPGTD